MKKIFKYLYNIFPFKYQIFRVIKNISPPHSIYKHLHFKGIFPVKINDSKGFLMRHYGFKLENEIFWSGLTERWEKESVKLWIKLCEFSENIVDIGANTGIYALIAKTIKPNANVYAFEPVPRVFKKLTENIKLNNYDIKTFQKAVSNFDGKAIIYDTPTEHIYSVTVNKNFNEPNTAVIETEIQTIKLNTFIKDNNIIKIDLIKIDVETHEPEVLEGFSDYLIKFSPTILIEILNDEVGKRVQTIVKDLNYLYFNIDEKGSIRRVDNITKSDYFNYLLCSPAIASKIGLIN